MRPVGAIVIESWKCTEMAVVMRVRARAGAISMKKTRLKGMNGAIESENGDLSDLSETNESDSKDGSEPPITLHLISFLSFLS